MLPLVIGVTDNIDFSVRGWAFLSFFWGPCSIRLLREAPLFPQLLKNKSSNIDIH